jgi:hypothetical protein
MNKATNDEYLKEFFMVYGSSMPGISRNMVMKLQIKANNPVRPFNKLKYFELPAKTKNVIQKYCNETYKTNPVGIHVDVKSLDKSFESIARGLYYHKHKEPFSGVIGCISYVARQGSFVLPTEGNKILGVINVADVIESIAKWQSETEKIANGVFCYMFGRVFNRLSLKMVFFDFVTIYVVFSENLSDKVALLKEEISLFISTKKQDSKAYGMYLSDLLYPLYSKVDKF